MTDNVRHLILAALAVQAAIGALGALSSAVSYAVGAGELTGRVVFILGCFLAAGLLYSVGPTRLPNDVFLLLVAFLMAEGLWAMLRHLFVFAEFGISNRWDSRVEIELGVRFILSLTAALLFIWWYKHSRRPAN